MGRDGEQWVTYPPGTSQKSRVNEAPEINDRCTTGYVRNPYCIFRYVCYPPSIYTHLLPNHKAVTSYP